MASTLFLDDIDSLREALEYGEKFEYVFFWGPKHGGGNQRYNSFSQWHKSKHIADGQEFVCAEQHMMWYKAVQFNDYVTANKILNETNPAIIKDLGREVSDYDDQVWADWRYEYVLDVNVHKFLQNEKLGDLLLETDGKILVEASPYDRIWGIGMTADNPKALDPLTWDGTNLLGFVLMQTRELIKFARAHNLKTVEELMQLIITDHEYTSVLHNRIANNEGDIDVTSLSREELEADHANRRKSRGLD